MRTHREKMAVIDLVEKHGAEVAAGMCGYGSAQSVKVAYRTFKGQVEAGQQIKTCKVCGNEYDYNSCGTWLYCSAKCQSKAKNQSSKSYYGRAAFLEQR